MGRRRRGATTNSSSIRVCGVSATFRRAASHWSRYAQGIPRQRDYPRTQIKSATHTRSRGKIETMDGI